MSILPLPVWYLSLAAKLNNPQRQVRISTSLAGSGTKLTCRNAVDFHSPFGLNFKKVFFQRIWQQTTDSLPA